MGVIELISKVGEYGVVQYLKLDEEKVKRTCYESSGEIIEELTYTVRNTQQFMLRMVNEWDYCILVEVT